jgi:hypothetical protein
MPITNFKIPDMENVFVRLGHWNLPSRMEWKTHKIIILLLVGIGLSFGAPETGLDVAGFVYPSKVNKDQEWYISNEEDKCTEP